MKGQDIIYKNQQLIYNIQDYISKLKNISEAKTTTEYLENEFNCFIQSIKRDIDNSTE